MQPMKKAVTPRWRFRREGGEGGIGRETHALRRKRLSSLHKSVANQVPPAQVEPPVHTQVTVPGGTPWLVFTIAYNAGHRSRVVNPRVAPAQYLIVELLRGVQGQVLYTGKEAPLPLPAREALIHELQATANLGDTLDPQLASPGVTKDKMDKRSEAIKATRGVDERGRNDPISREGDGGGGEKYRRGWNEERDKQKMTQK